MSIKLLSAELACEKAWQTYCLMNPAAPAEFKEDLDSYLSKLEVLGSSSLVVDGLKYLKGLQAVKGRKFKKIKRTLF
jgi:hypothetical protein